MAAGPLSPHLLDQYIAFRERCDQYIQLSSLWLAIAQGVFKPVQIGHYTTSHYTATLRDLVVASLPTFIDTRSDSLNVFELLPQVFPADEPRIRAIAEQLGPHLKLLRDFRNKVVFHSDRSRAVRLAARRAILSPAIGFAHSEFLRLCSELILSEPPELQAQLRAAGYHRPEA